MKFTVDIALGRGLWTQPVLVPDGKVGDDRVLPRCRLRAASPQMSGGIHFADPDPDTDSDTEVEFEGSR